MSNNSLPDKNNFPDILDALHQEHWHLTKILVLLIIISIASLGSLHLAQHLLPENPLVVSTPATTYTEGVCDSDPAQMEKQYMLPLSSSSAPSKPTVPDNW